MSTSEIANSVPYSNVIEIEEQTGEQNTRWHLAKRIIFRFIFAYLLLFNLPFPLNALNFTDSLAERYAKLWHTIVPWVGRSILHLSREITVFPNGSGDTTYNYVQLLCYLTLATSATLIWSLLDRRRNGYERLYQWLRIYIRFSLTSQMILYGVVKVIKFQFSYPSLDRLLQPFGDASPMGLLWTFMGASESYTVFVGAAEIVGGLLLVLPRTTMLGALLCIGVLSNVVFLNFSYDVPVKLFSLHLLAMSIFLIAPDLKRLADLFLFNRRVEPVKFPILFTKRWLNRGAVLFRFIFVLYILCYSLYSTYGGRRMFGDMAPKTPLYGIWFVDDFEIDGEVRPPLLTDETRWQRVIFDYPRDISIQFMSDSRQRYNLVLDMEKRNLTLIKRDDPNWKTDFSFTQPEPGLLTMEGTIDEHRIRAKMHRTEPPKFRLTNRGFHWISEYPFNP